MPDIVRRDNKNRKSVYSWKLTEADTVPKSKRNDIFLREKQIQKCLNDDIVLDGG
ncbi:integrase DNA-binding domain-containing protein [Konateibacter massiliensis]|uniref:integrase DNA-binding domain-containing protein n=1 Tax=Konateibacter massiliensis TaxID=2002841 RepID=UPI0015D4C794|nr:hypothetical protein [Konateibacter massiliensis]